VGRRQRNRAERRGELRGVAPGRVQDQGSPTFETRAPLPLVEVPPPPEAAWMLNGVNSVLRCYRLGECSIFVTREYGEWHLSIAHRGRYPTWDEIAEARYRLLPDDAHMALLLPPKSQYVNRHKNCFQLVQIRNHQEGSDDHRTDAPRDGRIERRQ
jgi:hypothetical protein